MAGIKARRKLQLGDEGVAGTATAATAIWRGEGTLEDTRVMGFPDEDVGLVAPTDRSHVAQLGGALTMTGVAAFEQLGYILSAGIKNVITGAVDGSGTGYSYTYPMPTTSDHTITTYTIEGGDNEQAEEMEYSFVESFTLEGAAGEPLMASADWVGRQVTSSSYTTSLTIPSVEDILVSKGKVYINAVASSFGATQVSNTIEAVTINVATGLAGHHKVDGNKYFALTQRNGDNMAVTADLRFEHNSSATAEKRHQRSQTPRKIRLTWQGSALSTAGTTYTYKTLQIDLRGKWEAFSAIDEQDGNDVVTGTFRSGADTAGTDYAKFVVVADLLTALL